MSTTTQTNESKPNNPPVAKVRVGLITASIWERKADDRIFYSVSFERRYRDGNGDWQTAHNYDGGSELLALTKAADLAHTRILELKAGQ